MNREKVVFGFIILLAATLNFGFVYGDIDNPNHHHMWEFFAAIIVNLIAKAEAWRQEPVECTPCMRARMRRPEPVE